MFLLVTKAGLTRAGLVTYDFHSIGTHFLETLTVRLNDDPYHMAPTPPGKRYPRLWGPLSVDERSFEETGSHQPDSGHYQGASASFSGSQGRQAEIDTEI